MEKKVAIYITEKELKKVLRRHLFFKSIASKGEKVVAIRVEGILYNLPLSTNKIKWKK